MISDLQLGNCVTASGGTTATETALRGALDRFAPVQPVHDVQTYLRTRQPQPMIEGEEGLLITLPAKLQADTLAKLRACVYVRKLVADAMAVAAACRSAFNVFTKAVREGNWKLTRFRALYDEWAAKRDWVVLVNRAKAPASWKDGNVGLPDEFLKFVAGRFGEFGRRDAKRQAIMSIKRQWRTGRNEAGEPEAIPGYEGNWAKRDIHNEPAGWHYSNILREMKKRSQATKAVLKLLHEGEAAAREFLPHQLTSRRGLRFLEKVTFDDVRTDWLIFNPKTGLAEELWLLVARDEATAMVLGFVMHPATVREDGKATHLGVQQMKELAAQLLQTYPLPPYLMHWVVERGTATLAEAIQLALAELFDHRIKVHYTSMIGGRSATGYKEKGKGNSRGKASHEAHNRLFHTAGSFVAGQTGSHYSLRPQDLKARTDEAHAIWLNARQLPAPLQEQVKYPLPTLAKAREIVRELCHRQNFRQDHALEDFEPVLEWFNAAAGEWQTSGSLDPINKNNVPFRKRMEMPVERALRLIQAVERWDNVSPAIIRTFLEHTQRMEKVEANGEIKLMYEGKTLWFKAPAAEYALPAGTRCLAYHLPQDPQFLHLTSGDGRILGTWVQRGRTPFQDAEALAQAMRYTGEARKQAKAVAADLAAPQRAALAAMRTHNAGLAAQPFEVITEAPGATGQVGTTPVGAALQTNAVVGAEMKVNPPVVPPPDDCTAELLERAKLAPDPTTENWG